MGAPSLYDLVVDRTFNTTNQPINIPKGCDFLWWYDLDLNWLLFELKTPHILSLFFWARIHRGPYVGHGNIKVEILFLLW